MKPNRNLLMNLKLLAAAASACLATSLRAEEPPLFQWLLVGDTVVSNVYVTASTPAHLILKFDGGSTKLKRNEAPDALKKLYPYDAEEAAAYERQQEEERQRRATEARARQEQTWREIKAGLQRQERAIVERIGTLERQVRQLRTEMGPLGARAKGKPNSPARAELDAARERVQDLLRRIHEQQDLLLRVRKQLDVMV